MRSAAYIIYLLLLFAGCSVSSEDFSGTFDEECVLDIHIGYPVSRSFNGVVAETWEKKINTATIYIFDSQGKGVFARVLTATEISAVNANSNLTVSFILPIATGTCDVYMVANTVPSASALTKSSFLNSVEQDIVTYNGTYSDVTTKALRTNGFVMVGSKSNVALNSGGTVVIPITLARIVAKVAIEFNISALITLGTSTVTNVSITKSSPASNLFSLSSYNTGGTAVTLSQVAQQDATNKRQFRAFFYIYENASQTVTANQINVAFSVANNVLGIVTTYNYNFKISGDGSGKITRNRGYYIVANINKLINILSAEKKIEGGNVCCEETVY